VHLKVPVLWGCWQAFIQNLDRMREILFYNRKSVAGMARQGGMASEILRPRETRKKADGIGLGD